MIYKSILILLLWVHGGQTALSKANPIEHELWESWKECRISIPDHYAIRPSQLESMLLAMNNCSELSIGIAGRSFEGRPIYAIEWGRGPIRVLSWSQMHGDEPTGTSAILDALGFLVENHRHEDIIELSKKVTCLFVPMLNPDGAELFQRRNAQEIDINRDALALTSPEAKILKKVYEDFAPDVAFNLHNQPPLAEVGESGKEVMMAVLAPPAGPSPSREPHWLLAKKICAEIRRTLSPYSGGRIAKYGEEFNPRAFGDNMTSWGTSVVAIEMGSDCGKGKDYLVRMNYVALLMPLFKLAFGKLDGVDLTFYENLKLNRWNQRFDWIFEDATLISISNSIPFQTDVGINLSFGYNRDNQLCSRASVADIGDLSVFNCRHHVNASSLVLSAFDLAGGIPGGRIKPGAETIFVYRKKCPERSPCPTNLILIAKIQNGFLEYFDSDEMRENRYFPPAILRDKS